MLNQCRWVSDENDYAVFNAGSIPSVEMPMALPWVHAKQPSSGLKAVTDPVT
jgi:hypothetical protein